MNAHHSPRLLLIAFNSSWYQSNPALYYLRQMIRDLDYEIRMLDFTVNDLIMDSLAGICSEQPDILCFSVYIWNREYLAKLLPDLKLLLPVARIVLGGPEAGALADLADIVITGPGEAQFRHLALNGFTGKLPSPSHLHLKDLPFPYLPEDAKRLEGKLLYYESSRGCPFKCAYCLSALDERNEYRFDCQDPRDLMRLADELDALEALGPRTVKFVDRSFNLDPAYARAVWTLLISSQRNCEWHFEIYPDLLGEEDLILLERVPAGLIRFEVGIQSTLDSINLACGRHSNWQKASQTLIALRDRTAVTVHADLLCGLPDQSFQDVLDSIDALAVCHPEEIQLGMLKVLPDTPMREIASQRGWTWSQSPPYTILGTDTMSFFELRECEALARILNLYWNKGEFSAQWRELLSTHSASAILIGLLDWHRSHDLHLHSISKGKRAEVFMEAVSDRVIRL